MTKDVHVGNPGPPITYDYMPIPKKPYLAECRTLNRKFNRYLAFSFLCLGVSIGAAYYFDTFEMDAILRPPQSYRQRHVKKSPAIGNIKHEKDASDGGGNSEGV